MIIKLQVLIGSYVFKVIRYSRMMLLLVTSSIRRYFDSLGSGSLRSAKRRSTVNAALLKGARVTPFLSFASEAFTQRLTYKRILAANLPLIFSPQCQHTVTRWLAVIEYPAPKPLPLSWSCRSARGVTLSEHATTFSSPKCNHHVNSARLFVRATAKCCRYRRHKRLKADNNASSLLGNQRRLPFNQSPHQFWRHS